MVADEVALGDGGGVAPELGGADDLAVAVEGDEAVLLAADADAGDLPAALAELGDEFLHGFVDGGGPGGGILLEMAGRQAG